MTLSIDLLFLNIEWHPTCAVLCSHYYHSYLFALTNKKYKGSQDDYFDLIIYFTYKITGSVGFVFEFQSGKLSCAMMS